MNDQDEYAITQHNLCCQQYGLEPRHDRPGLTLLEYVAAITKDRDDWKEEAFLRGAEGEALKAAANTLLSDLARKWDVEGTRCGEEGRNSDEAWDADGDEWRERRAVYFECAEQLKAALRKLTANTHTP